MEGASRSSPCPRLWRVPCHTRERQRGEGRVRGEPARAQDTGDMAHRGASAVRSSRMADPQAAHDLAPEESFEGQIIGGKYRVGPLVGSGGMGTVWLGQ